MPMTGWIELDGRRFDILPGEPALDALLRQGAPVTFSCRKGTCRSCMLQALSGDPGREAQAPLPQDWRDAGFFLPCCATSTGTVRAQRPDLSLCLQTAVVAGVDLLTPGILRLRLELMHEIDWLPGQVVGLMNEGGAVRPYSIVSRKSDYFLDLHLRLYPGGAVSGWAAGLSVGDELRLQAPSGNMVWTDDLADRPMLLIGSGSGGGVLAGIARDAVARGHRGPIRLCHGASRAEDLYLQPLLADLPAGRVALTEASSQQPHAGQPPARITDLAFAKAGDLSATAIFLCGHPDMVETARVRALRAGADPALIRCDPFDPPQPYRPTEGEKLATFPPDPELWQALDHGDKLTAILRDFYTQVYEDPRLAPFFHRATMQRSIEKQFSFPQDVLSGTRLYFGEKPFNAHHWMIISDDLFNYRERLFFQVVRRHGVAEPLIHRWAALHELFRREIVKATPRGLMRNGVEVPLNGYSQEVMAVGTVCDGCHGPVEAGETVLMHSRTGETFCATCQGARGNVVAMAPGTV